MHFTESFDQKFRDFANDYVMSKIHKYLSILMTNLFSLFINDSFVLFVEFNPNSAGIPNVA